MNERSYTGIGLTKPPPMNPAQCCNSECDSSPATSSIIRLREKLVCLDERINILGKKIRPALLPETPCPAGCADKQAQECRSDLVLSLDDMGMHVTRINMTVDDLLNRCQL